MRYKINNLEIRTENAAKPHTLQSRHLLEHITKIGPVESTLDYGCGKLRYGHELSKISKRITFTDSKIQITRKQKIRGVDTSVLEHVENHIKNGKCLSLEEIEHHQEPYHLITCINVLSAIPCQSTINLTLQNINRLLSSDGTALFVTQHRSSHFKKYINPKNKHLHGYINTNRQGTTYYGILKKESLEALLKENGFNVYKSWITTESSYVEARKNNIV